MIFNFCSFFIKTPRASYRNAGCNNLCVAILTLLCTTGFAKELLVTPETLKAVWASVLPGDRVVFSPGEYRDSLSVPVNRSWSAGVPTVFTAVTPESVFIKGSDVVIGWIAVDGVRYAKEWANEPSQVFVDGTALTQLAGSVFGGYPNEPVISYIGMHRDSGGIWPGRVAYTPGSPMPMNSFFYDKSAHRLYLCMQGNPNQKKIEVSVRGRLFYAEGVNGIVLEKLVFEHSNTSVTGRGAAVTVIGNDNIIRGITVRQTDLAGIQMVGDRNQLLNSFARNNGQLGVAMRGTNNRVSNVDASYNNTRGFNKWWEAGGFKFVGKGGLQSSEVVNNTAIGNTGDGIWFDWKNKNNIIRNNILAYNSGFGIHYEASRSGVIQDNFVFGNGQHGIYLADSANTWVTHNMVIGNNLHGIIAVFTGRKDENGAEFGAEDNKVYANIVGWNKGLSLVMPEGALRAGESDGNAFLFNQQSAQFSLGFPSVLSPAMRSLNEWSRQSGFDKRSVVNTMQMPADIASALSQKMRDLDWIAVRTEVNSLRKASGFHLDGVVLPAHQEETIGPRKLSEK